jgi:hypothetical protein
VDQQQVGVRRLLGHGGLGGHDGAHPAPSRRPGNGDEAKGTMTPFGLTAILTLIFSPNGVG